MTAPSTAVVGCRQVVTLSGPARPRTGPELQELGIIENGAFTIDAEGRVEVVGTRAQVEPLIGPATRVVDAGGRVVLPGFVDAHTHIVFAGTRADELEWKAAGLSYQEIAAKGGGIRSTVRKTRAAAEAVLVDAARRYANWFLRCGTTTVEAKSGYGLSLEDELKILRATRALAAATPLRIVPTFLGAHIVPDEYRNDRGAYVDLLIERMLPEVAAGGLAEYCDVFCDEGAFTLAEAERILEAGKGYGLRPRLHADQLAAGEAAQLAARVGAVTADHLEHTGRAGIAALRAGGVQPVLLPGSVYAIGSQRYPAAREMIAAGLAVVLATDFNPGSSPTPSMPMVLSLSVTHLKMLPAEAVSAATINAAYSLGRGDELGSLEPGKAADFVLYDADDYSEIPYFFGVELAVGTYINGRLASEPGRLQLMKG